MLDPAPKIFETCGIQSLNSPICKIMIYHKNFTLSILITKLSFNKTPKSKTLSNYCIPPYPYS